MFRPIAFAILSMAVTAPVFAPVAALAAPKHVIGERCHFPHVAKGTWVGFFDGYEATFDAFKMHDSRESITVWRCFKTKADCTAWKYWMQTDYRAGPQVTWCRKK